MSSIIEGYNYDIFISYRQKDNKYDGWVTEFVDNLRKELEATFKEEISVYFDINPHGGLLETHDVDASLKDKLKCLVFIPNISRTYCDLKSFAWEHEFKAFVERASQDQFGLKVKLPNGNVANRVLPVRIHDLDASDIKLCESVLGGIKDKAEKYYRQALSLEPDSALRLNNLAYFLIDNDRNINEGIELVNKALISAPEDYNYLHTKGWGLYKQRKYQEALDTLQKSWDLRREKAIYDHEAYLHLEAAKKAVAGETNN